METTAAFRSAMVSRLPKFGGRSSNGGTSALPNGLTQPTPPQDGKTTHPNGVIRAPSFSFKWKKDEVIKTTSPTTDGASEEKPKTQMAAPTKEIKKASPGTPKMRRSGPLMVAVSSPKSIPKQATKTSPKTDTKISQSPLSGSLKLSHSGSTPVVEESNPVRPKLRSSSPRSSSQDSLSQSSDCLKSLPQDNMVRSNSFTHFKQIPSPSNQPMTRSFSFNRAVELAKPLANTQLRPPRSSLLKPPQLSNGRVGLGMGGLNGNLSGSGGLSISLGGLHYSRNSQTASSLPTLSSPSAPNTPSSLKKPLLPNCVLNKSLNSNFASVGQRLARPSPVKQPLLPGRAKEKLQPLAPERRALIALTSDTESAEKAEKSDFHSDSDGSSLDKNGVCRQSQNGACAETLEDMSFSSASSLDRGDTSEECLDDFDSSGDVLSDVDTTEKSDNTQTRLQRLLDNTADWPHPDMAGPKDISPMDVSCGSLVLSPETGHAPAGSSLELSPSNSSGGTYMWDEEGLEPIGLSASHPGDSYEDTDLNSLDILEHLEPLTDAQLEEDDLMLEVELPEDSLHEMSHVELSERGRLGPRRRHHRWSAPDHFHNNSRMHGFQHYDGYKAPRFSSRPFHSEGKQHGHIPALDELTLEHMSQDCSALKSHLLRLRDLLQLEDTDSPDDVAEVEAEDKLQELIKEVQGLREELKSRDRTIAQLTLQCQQLQQQQPQQMPAQGHQVRCQCPHQRAPHSLRTSDQQMDKRKQQHYDKATQTAYRPPANTGVLPTPMLSPWQAQAQGLARTSMPQHRHTSNTTAFQAQPQRASAPGKTNKSSLHRGPQ
ncbi:serine-rich coiled-coil domain-containing protein 2 isoform X2 [Boleophthalmus pectinirostris]|uniref:serine-rich coiled-coil domain-containing protein 2 isoform X2 n=1 Tax=Boleophthalmus pectinirostris TaxID=150288 RepID=UPI00242F8809|nr:serine-rich coiled-coil domain-containing protein 2 isoform X2 [Boleophthalmus pectinirostris]